MSFLNWSKHQSFESASLAAHLSAQQCRIGTAAGTRTFCHFGKDSVMAASSPRQRKTTGRVMHELKHGELRSGPGGKGGKVKSRKQAIAIALNEAGASKRQSPSEKR